MLCSSSDFLDWEVHIGLLELTAHSASMNSGLHPYLSNGSSVWFLEDTGFFSREGIFQRANRHEGQSLDQEQTRLFRSLVPLLLGAMHQGGAIFRKNPSLFD